MHIRYYRSVRLSADTNGRMVLWVEMEPGSINERRFQARLPGGGRLTFERKVVESLNQGGIYMATTSLIGNDAGLHVVNLVPRGPDDVAIRAFERYKAGAEKAKRRMWQLNEISRAQRGETGKESADIEAFDDALARVVLTPRTVDEDRRLHTFIYGRFCRARRMLRYAGDCMSLSRSVRVQRPVCQGTLKPGRGIFSTVQRQVRRQAWIAPLLALGIGSLLFRACRPYNSQGRAA